MVYPIYRFGESSLAEATDDGNDERWDARHLLPKTRPADLPSALARPESRGRCRAARGSLSSCLSKCPSRGRNRVCTT